MPLSIFRSRKKRSGETGGSTSHPSPPTTKSRGSRLLSEAGDVIQLVSPMVQVVAGAIPVAGTSLQAVVGALICIVQMIDTTKRNKTAINDLSVRLYRLLEFLSLEPQPRDEVEAKRRKALAQHLQDTSGKLAKMKGGRRFTLAYKSITQDTADCNTDIDRFLSEYALYDLALIKTQLKQMLVSPQIYVILINAAGREREVQLEHCTSLQQLKDMLPVLIPPKKRSGASVQKRLMTLGKSDFCIDDGEKVALLTGLTSDPNVWQNMDTKADTRVVMKAVFEGRATHFATYECRLCGAWNKFVSLKNSSEWLTDGSLDCHACKGRFQTSFDRDGTRPGKLRTTRNSRVTQIEPGDPGMIWRVWGVIKWLLHAIMLMMTLLGLITQRLATLSREDDTTCANAEGEEVLFEGYENEMEEYACANEDGEDVPFEGCEGEIGEYDMRGEEVPFEGYENEMEEYREEEVPFEGYEYGWEEGENELETLRYDPHLEWNEY